jgi:hypothetical protein
MAPYFLALRAVTQRNLAFFLERQDAIQVTKTNRKFYRVTKKHAKVLQKFGDRPVNNKNLPSACTSQLSKTYKKFKYLGFESV